jgi:hypothetical protein
MILRGILDQSLGRYCIRGYAFLGDLERVSRADFGFQRNMIIKQKETIVKFLESDDLFFPEVILSYVIRQKIFTRGRIPTIRIDPLQTIISGKRFLSNIDKITFTTKTVRYRNIQDSRGIDTTNIITLKIDDDRLAELINLNQQPFLRIDGNHRLSAASEFRDHERVTKMIAPFCLILLPDMRPIPSPLVSMDDEQPIVTKFEKTVFHNINSKSVPLTEEEIYRVIIEDDINFTNAELLSRDDFGPNYSFTRNIWKKITPEIYPSIGHLLYSEKDNVHFVKTILVNLFNLLREYGLINEKFTQFNIVDRIFKKVEQRYDDNVLLKRSNSHGLLIAFLYFTFKGNKFNLDWFTDWILENHIYELTDVSPNDLISIFEKILLSKHRTIFISMEFDNPVCEKHYNAVTNLIEEINRERDAGIKLYPLRIDRFRDGSAYKIPDAILNKIFDSGLLIADLTFSNPNVYHEVGYIMGLHRLRNRRKINLTLICNVAKTDFPVVGFNIRNHHIIGFKNTDELTNELKGQIINFYFKD